VGAAEHRPGSALVDARDTLLNDAAERDTSTQI
jgi:hypothetical protein